MWSAPIRAAKAGEDRIRDIPAGRRIAADQPGRDAIGGTGRTGRPGRRPSRRCRAGSPARRPRRRWVSASALASTSPGDQSGFVLAATPGAVGRRGRATDARTGRRPSATIRAWGTAGGSSRTRVAGRIPAAAARRRSSRPSCGRRPGSPGRPAPPPGTRRPGPPRCRGSDGGPASARSGRDPAGRQRSPGGPWRRAPGPTRHQIRADAVTPWIRTSGRSAGVAPGRGPRTGYPRRLVVNRSPVCGIGAIERCRDVRRQVGSRCTIAAGRRIADSCGPTVDRRAHPSHEGAVAR